MNDVREIEIRTRDAARARWFFGLLFDWTFHELGLERLVIDTGTAPSGILAPGEGVLASIGVEDPAATSRRAEHLGGRAAQEDGRVLVRDPWGNELGLISGPQSGTAGPRPMAGRNPFCWLELRVPSPMDAADYYEALFGWSFEVHPGHTFGLAHTKLAAGKVGIGLAGRESAAPTPYIYTEDLAAAASSIAGIGGRVAHAPREIPHLAYGTSFRDPDGNRLGIFSPVPPPPG